MASLAMSVFAVAVLLFQLTSCKKAIGQTNHDCPPAIYQVEGLYIGTYSVSSKPELGNLYYSFVIFPDGSYIEEPSNSELAEKIGLKTRAQMPFYDLIIVGGGPAGLAAAVYGASEGLSTLLIERQAPGGQAGVRPSSLCWTGSPTVAASPRSSPLMIIGLPTVSR